jgi:hypothetical protein
MSPPVDTGIISLGLGASPQRFFNILEILRRHGIEFFGGRELSFNAAEKRNKLAPFHRLFQTQDVGTPPAVAAVDEVGRRPGPGRKSTFEAVGLEPSFLL